ncbi:MAG TPA: hypothetical protein DDZ88_29990 [Verrucomicrobiales bacterium]|nr:hypothetical protein [Verrucomicrobiales bacterium]
MARYTITAKEIAGLMGVSKTWVFRRANSEKWPFTEVSVRGGQQRLFYVRMLPDDIRRLIQGEEEMKKTLEERLEPAAGRIADMTERFFGSTAFDRMCIATGIFALGWLVAWVHFIGQRG